MKNDLKFQINHNVKTVENLFNYEKIIFKIIKQISSCLKKGKKVLICGNGGSNADAQHLSTEFLVRLRPNINRRSYPVISLSQDVSTVTACGNDLGFENIFSRNLEGLYSNGDILLILSTSGNSKNILKVLKKAKQMNVNTISILGNNGGKARKMAKIELLINEKNVARIQEAQKFLGHYIFEKVENILIKK
jgi:D-sedoheptulose 7-phosphate isomerase